MFIEVAHERHLSSHLLINSLLLRHGKSIQSIFKEKRRRTDGNTRLSWWVNEDGGPLNMMMRFLAKKRHMRIIIVKYWQAATVTINYSVLCFGSIFAVIRHELLSVQLCAKRNQCLVQRSVLIISEDVNFNTRSSSSRRSFQAPIHDLCCCTVDLRFLTHPKRYDKCAKVRQGTASELQWQSKQFLGIKSGILHWNREVVREKLGNNTGN